MQSVLLALLIAVCVWLAVAEGLVSAAFFFAFGLIVIVVCLPSCWSWAVRSAASSITSCVVLAAAIEAVQIGHRLGALLSLLPLDVS